MPQMLLMFPFLAICMAVHHDPVIGMFIILKWVGIVVGCGLIILFPFLIIGHTKYQKEKLLRAKEWEAELKKKYPGLKNFGELLKETEEKKLEYAPGVPASEDGPISPEFAEAINTPPTFPGMPSAIIGANVRGRIDVSKTVFNIIADRKWKNGYLQDLCRAALNGELDWSYTDFENPTDKNLKEREKYKCYLK